MFSKLSLCPQGGVPNSHNFSITKMGISSTWKTVKQEGNELISMDIV